MVRNSLASHSTARGLLAVLLLISCASILTAQSSGIVGTVTDPSGAVVAGATVSIVNTDTQFTRTVETNTGGEYVATPLPAGKYAVKVDSSGFRKLERTGIELNAATTIRVDLQLALGSSVESVEVTAAASLVQSETATVSALVDSTRMVQLPLVARDFTDLVLLTPGAHTGTASNTALGGSGYATRSGANYSVNGSIPQGNSYLIDGIYNRNLWLNGPIIVPVVDAIREYRVMTSSLNAEYGEAAGAVTTVDTKSGTKEIHGSAWEFLRNDKLNANGFFNNLNKIARPPFHRNEFGATPRVVRSSRTRASSLAITRASVWPSRKPRPTSSISRQPPSARWCRPAISVASAPPFTIPTTWLTGSASPSPATGFR